MAAQVWVLYIYHIYHILNDVHVSPITSSEQGCEKLKSTHAAEVIRGVFSTSDSAFSPSQIMQHLQAEGFSEEVSKLAAEPRKLSNV